MNRIPIAVLALALTTGACSPKSEGYAEEAAPAVNYYSPRSDSAVAAEATPPAAEAPAPASLGSSGEGAGSDRPAVNIPAGAAMLAYSYDYALEAPAKQVRGLIARHEAACRAAGPLRCQVTGSSVREAGADRVGGSLSMQAQPAWLDQFRKGLAGEAKAAGGRVARAATETEDLSREIVDVEARLRAMTTLRDRLQALLASRPGKLQELLEVERELARVQGDIDSATSQLAVMRQRVATSQITLEYASLGVLAPEGVFSPIGHAIGDVGVLMVEVLAGLIRILAVLFPLAVLVGLAVFSVKQLRRGKPPLFRLPVWPWARKPAPVPPAPKPARRKPSKP